ncbi:MFS transporter [Pseudonocardia acaciae]|uniref:MFS transporter n=1 Tax=Pseudonocardia acaciae TaxID=551276 RepID=UPI000AF55F95|nr:MFS transporter [Pseudonocardia acaciae]
MWAAATVSGFGTYITTLAVQVLIVVTLHEGAAEVGLVSSARWLPYLLFGLVAGVLIDRARRRPLLVGMDLGRAVLLVAVPALALVGRLSMGALMVFMAVFGLMSLFGDGASQSFLPRVVPGHLLTAANARLDQSDAVAQTSGPALAGGLVSLLGAPLAVLVDAASYLVSGLLLLRVPVVEPPGRRATLRDVGREAAEGMRWMYRHPHLRPLALSTHGWFLCFAAAGAVLAPFALRTLGLSPFGFGVALAFAGIGGLAGSLAATRLGARFGAGRVIIACRAATGVSWALMPLAGADWSGAVLFGAGQLLLGLSMGAENANEMGYWQVATPDAMQGRVNTTRRSINRAMIVLGAPVGGVLGDTFGFRTMMWTAAAGFLAVAAALAASRSRDARIECAGQDP